MPYWVYFGIDKNLLDMRFYSCNPVVSTDFDQRPYLIITSTNEGSALSYWETMLDESLPRKMAPIDPLVKSHLGSDKTLSVEFLHDIFEVNQC